MTKLFALVLSLAAIVAAGAILYLIVWRILDTVQSLIDRRQRRRDREV